MPCESPGPSSGFLCLWAIGWVVHWVLTLGYDFLFQAGQATVAGKPLTEQDLANLKKRQQQQQLLNKQQQQVGVFLLAYLLVPSRLPNCFLYLIIGASMLYIVRFTFVALVNYWLAHFWDII